MRIIAEVAARYRDDLAPAIDRVWEDGVAAIRADLREWLRRASEDDSGYVPWYFELSFGLEHRPERRQADPQSVPGAVDLDCGIQLRGSIDLVERHPSGMARVTDHKTGKADGKPTQLIAGGKSLQPLLYALAAEKLFAGQAKISSGRLYFCTSAGGFAEQVVVLDDQARAAAVQVAEAIGDAVAQPFLPAAPDKRQCDLCDFRVVCGPYEERRAARKPQGNLEPLLALRAVAMTDPADAEARRRILAEYGTSFFVEAAAGTGKTTALVGRIVGLIRAGAGTLNRIVAVTFTEKAAGEMKLRLRSEIEKVRPLAAREERDRLDRALEELELARIGTIHAFCGDLLHERPIEAGIDPLFEVASEDEAEAIADAAFENWFQKILSDPPEGVRRILRRRSGRQSPREQLRGAMQALREHRDFPEPWRREPFDRSRAIDALMDELARLGALAATSSWPEDYLARNLTEISRFVEESTRLEAVRDRDYDGLEAELRTVARWRSWTWKGAQRTTFGTLSRNEALALRDQAKANLDAFIAASDADLAPLLHDALQAPISGL